MDQALSLIGLALLLPVFLMIVAAIRRDSPGAAIFKQERIGVAGQPFTLYKFRTMRADNDSKIHQDYVRALITGRPETVDGQFKIANDPRITRIGRFLRRSSLDELPQLLNVLKGEMSLVGPRPALPYEVELHGATERLRLLVKPGLTGLWQVSGRTTVDFSSMIAFDLEYIERWSLWLDASIILRTIPAMMRQKGW